MRAGEFARLEAEFVESLHNLTRYYVPEKYVWPLVCKVFGCRLSEEPSQLQLQNYVNLKNHVLKLSRNYVSELGENAYAALNVLTDIASRPVAVASSATRVDSMQRKSGAWIKEFLGQVQSTEFHFDHYLGEYIDAA